MSSFFDTLLSGNGCSLEGTTSFRNPLSSAADRLLESHLGPLGNELGLFQGGREEQEAYGILEGTPDLSLAHSQDLGQGLQFESSNIFQGVGFGGNEWGARMFAPDFGPQSSMAALHMQSLMHMQVQHHRHMMMMNEQQLLHEREEHARFMQQQQQRRDYKERQQRVQFAQSPQTMAHSPTTNPAEMEPWQHSVNLEHALMQAINEGDMSPERMTEIWNTFGGGEAYASARGKDMAAEGLNSLSSMDEKRKWHQALESTAASGPTQTGYDEVWKALSHKLENLDRDKYTFVVDNPHLMEASLTSELTNVVSKEATQMNESSLTLNTAEAQEQQHDGLYQLGLEYYHQGRIRDAILALEAHVQRQHEDLNEDVGESWKLLGVCHAENDDDKTAIVCFRKAIECDPYNLDALLALGTSYVNDLDSTNALHSLRLWISNNPRFQGLKVEVDEYSDGTLMDEVMQLMNAASAWAPNDPEVQSVLGVLYNVSQDYKVAIECFQKALDHRPEDYSLMNKIGATMANSDSSADAIPFYARALQIRPRYARGWLNLGIAYSNLDKYAESANAYLQALQLNPSARHIWGYIRTVFTCMDRLDLVELSSKEDIAGIARALNFQLLDA